MIKAICLDLDGTLLNSESEISGKDREATGIYIDRGTKVVISSGVAEAINRLVFNG